MLKSSFKKFYNRGTFLMLLNRCSKRSEHVSLKYFEEASNKKCENLKKNNKLTENVKINQLPDFSPPKPFDEIPLYEDPKDIDFHPAEFIDNMGPPLPISFNLAAYVNHSETLVKLVQLGVNLSEFDKYPEKSKFILKLDFEKHIKKYIQFLHDHGVKSDNLGKFITKNPFIFREDLEDLEIRINYLQSKKFSVTAVASIIARNPYLLSMTTKSVDSRLGYFQKQFSLTGDEVRHVTEKCPQLISYKHEKFLEKIFIVKEVFGFTREEMKKLFVMRPRIWILGSRGLKERFDVVHNKMGIPQERILEFPGVLQTRMFKLKERHEYLVYLNRAQYDPTKPNYVSLFEFSTTSDSEFCERYAHTSVERYNEFLKTR